MQIAVIGAGWYGVHTALHLSSEYKVTLLEKNADIFFGVSGKFGVRLHAGPHYPRSACTRESCRNGMAEFKAQYPDIINDHKYSTYGLGIQDADGKRSKVNFAEFSKVCLETDGADKINLKEYGYTGMHGAYNVPEPSVAKKANEQL